MNSVNLIGRLTKDVEIRKTQEGKSVVKFTLAVNKAGEGADFITCVAWERRAEVIAQFCGKGSQLGIAGRIATSTYDDANGKKVYVTEVVAEKVDLLDQKEKHNEPSREKKPEEDMPDFNTGPLLDISSDDLPF